MDRADGWIQTYTGRQFWPLDPRPEHIQVEDIAHALSMLCRYNGHCLEFYSVAQHCVLMSHEVLPEHALWALLHDAAEAYLGDMPRPLKHQDEMAQFRLAETEIMLAVQDRFELGDEPFEIRDADNRMIATEKRDIMGDGVGKWLDHGQAYEVRIESWPPVVAERRFLDRFRELMEARR